MLEIVMRIVGATISRPRAINDRPYTHRRKASNTLYNLQKDTGKIDENSLQIL